VEEYWLLFEKLRSRMLLEGRHLSERDFIDVFVSGLKGAIKPLVMAFKPNSLDKAFEYALYMESAYETQMKNLRPTTRFNPGHITNSMKTPVDKHVSSNPKMMLPTNNPKHVMFEQRKALGQCFKCGDRYFLGHQYKIKLQMLMGQDESNSAYCLEQEEIEGTELHGEPAEEAIVSMHATSNHPIHNTMRFKGQVGTVSVYALIDSGSTHSFVSPSVL
jgi:hypothetical protein